MEPSRLESAKPQLPQIFSSLLSFGTNSSCFCCKSAQVPSFACTQHGIFVCSECGKEMESQPNINLKPLSTQDGWTSKDIQSLSYGGNSRFDEFLTPYLASLGKDKFSHNVFNLKATEFYSKRLDSFSSSGYFSEPPPSVREGASPTESAELLDLDYPHKDGNDFDMEIFGSDEKPDTKKPLEKDFFDALDDNVKEIFDTTGDIFQEHASKFWDKTSGLRDKTKLAWEKSEQSGKEVLDKTGQFTKQAWGKTITIFEKMGQGVKELAKKKENDKPKPKSKPKLTFKSLFGIFSKDSSVSSPREEKKVASEPEEQFFKFKPDRCQHDEDDSDNIDHLFMAREEQMPFEDNKQDSGLTECS